MQIRFVSFVPKYFNFVTVSRIYCFPVSFDIVLHSVHVTWTYI